MLTATQKKTAQAIVNIFETGSVLGDYGNVTRLPGDTGHLTFGRSQVTLGSGNLHDLLRQYCDNPGARFGASLHQYLSRLQSRDLSLDDDQYLHNLLQASADDVVMREMQDVFFDHRFWQSAERIAGQIGITTPLGVAVMYDSVVHGSVVRMRDRTNEQAGTLAALGEQQWIEAYVRTRRAWLAGNRLDLRPTVYRMDAFQRLIDQGYWGLELPLVVRGLEISRVTLEATPTSCFDGPQPGSRTLAVQTPLIRGLDVRLVQLGLSALRTNIKADGIYGNTSARCIREYQAAHGLPATGIADLSLITQLAACGIACPG